MNILVIHQNFPGQFKHLAPALVQQGHRVVTLTLRNTDLKEWNGVKIIRYGLERRVSGSTHPWVADFEAHVLRGEACFRAALKLKKDGFSPDVILAHPGWGESLFLKEIWPNAKLGIYCEYFLRTHGTDYRFDPEFSNKDEADVCRVVTKNANYALHLDIADAFICPTEWQASTFPQAFMDKMTIVHDGIDTNMVYPCHSAFLTLNNILKLTKNNKIITFVNRNLEPVRGYHIFMRSLPEIIARRRNAHILIVGGNDVSYGSRPDNGRTWKNIFIEEVKPYISDKDWKRVHFLGKIPYNYFIIMLQISTVHVYLTYPFIVSWSLLEAMSAGCSIIASNTAPVKEIVSDGSTGILTDFFDIHGLADRVCMLLDDAKIRKTLGKNARNFVREKYDLQRVCLPKQLEWVSALAGK